MTPQKLTGFHKFVTFVLIAIIIILVLGFAVNGWQANDNLPDSGDVGNTTDDTDENNNTNIKDENDNPLNQPNTQLPPENNKPDTPSDEPEIEEVIYISPITGLEISLEKYNTSPVGVVVDPKAPLYGISETDIAIEFPIEDGSSRLLAYGTNEDILWKIGALRPTRNFISRMSDFFGGIVVSYGHDDKIIYDAWEVDSFFLDLSQYNDCYYIENTLYVYTSEKMIELAKTKQYSLQSDSFYKKAPFDFYSESSFAGTGTASTVIIPYSDKNETELYYHEKSGEYLYYKSANRKMDMLTGKNISYKNVFILFADSTTYEKSDGSELVIDIDSGGKGYYISNGTYCEFVWRTDLSGALCFYTLSGETLKVNPGNSYISFYKSSITSKVSLI